VPEELARMGVGRPTGTAAKPGSKKNP
jgi:hypothetical protein